MSFSLGVTPYPLLSPDSEDFSGLSLACEIKQHSFDPATLTVTLSFQFATNEKPELEYFSALCQEGIAERLVLIESPESLHRSVEHVTSSGFLSRGNGELYGRVSVTPFVVALTDIDNFNPPNSHPEWGDSPTAVAQGDVIAVGETLRFEISQKLSSRRPMIDLRVSPDLDERVYRVDPTGDVIVVLAGEAIREAIQIMSKDPLYKPALFMSLYKDVLQEGLRQARDTGGEQAWLRSLEKHLEIDDIESLPDDELLEAPQRLLFEHGAKKVLVNSENG